MQKPEAKPRVANFGSGPTCKRPGGGARIHAQARARRHPEQADFSRRGGEPGVHVLGVEADFDRVVPGAEREEVSRLGLPGHPNALVQLIGDVVCRNRYLNSL